MIKLVYFGRIDETGKLCVTNNRGLLSDLKDFIGKHVRITIENKSKRSDPQNRYFHGVVIPIVKAHLLDLGWKEARSNEWVKDYIKYNCLIKEVSNEDSGEVIKTLGATSGLTTSEFCDFIADIQQWSAEKLGLIIPDPGEVLEMDLS